MKPVSLIYDLQFEIRVLEKSKIGNRKSKTEFMFNNFTQRQNRYPYPDLKQRLLFPINSRYEGEET